jgi:hypothetical protein
MFEFSCLTHLPFLFHLLVAQMQICCQEILAHHQSQDSFDVLELLRKKELVEHIFNALQNKNIYCSAKVVHNHLLKWRKVIVKFASPEHHCVDHFLFVCN